MKGRHDGGCAWLCVCTTELESVLTETQERDSKGLSSIDRGGQLSQELTSICVMHV